MDSLSLFIHLLTIQFYKFKLKCEAGKVRDRKREMERDREREEIQISKKNIDKKSRQLGVTYYSVTSLLWTVCPCLSIGSSTIVMQVCKENPKFGGEGQKLKKAACRNRVCENQENQQVRVQNLFENVCIFIFRFRT